MTDPGWIHLGIEAAKLAMADRDAYLTDPAFRDVPVELLLDPAHAAELAARIDPRRAATPARRRPTRAAAGRSTSRPSTRDGNAVSLIESNYLGFGSGVVDPATGIHYQNRGSYFSLDPDHPNVLEPGKRTLHTLLPGMLFRDGEPGPWVVAGSMGGDAQPQIHAQLVSALVDGGVDVADRGRRAALVRRAGRPLRAAARGPPRAAPRDRASPTRSSALGHPLVADRAVRLEPRPRARDRAGRRRPGRARRLGGGGHRPAQRRAPGRLVGHVRRSAGIRACICDTPRPVAGCAHTKPPPAAVVRGAARGGP